MKRLGKIFCLTALIVTLTASVCFGAQSLKIVDSYPRDNQKNTTKDNMCVKLWFNNDMDDKGLNKINKDCFTITDPDGKKLPIKVFHDSPKNKKEIIVLADTSKVSLSDVKDNTTYTLTVSPDFQDKNGNKLGQETKISFTTLNQKKNQSVYMVLMFLMMGGMFFFSSMQMKRQQAAQNEGPVKEEPFNPYKEAKKTGKSVEEVMAIHEKEVAKKEAKEARKAAHHKQPEEDYDDDDDEIEDNGNYKVKGPRPISAGGGKYKSGRKALAEARKAEEERLEKRRAANKKHKKKK